MTDKRCDHCPATEGLPCRAGGTFCDWAAAGDPVHLRHIADVALGDAGRPMSPQQPAVPCPDAATASVPAPVLAGDLVAALTEALGVDRLTKWIARRAGVECGCESRRVAINRMDAAARRYLGRLGGGKAS